jgi:predicted molibdopterin-dependent oxidoreductase YjgC
MASQTLTVEIDGRQVAAAAGETLLAVCRRIGKEIPTLCHHEALEPYASCRICLVEVSSGGGGALVASCHYPASDGLVVLTDSPRVRQVRKVMLQLLLARCPSSEPIRALAARYGVTSTPYAGDDPEEKCILCGLCVRACEDLLKVAAVGFARRGTSRRVSPPFEEPPDACIGCGACACVCPTGNIEAKYGDAVVRLAKWGKDVPLAPCRLCGRPVAPRALLERVRAGDWDAARRDLCPSCLQRLIGRNCADAALVGYTSRARELRARRASESMPRTRKQT